MVYLNWLAIILAAIAYYILGGLWFAEFAFGKLWHIAIGFEPPKGWKPPVSYYIVPFIGGLVISIATAVLIAAFHIQSYSQGFMFAITVGIGYAASVSYVNALTPKTPRPFLQATITSIYHTIGIILVTSIIVAMR